LPTKTIVNTKTKLTQRVSFNYYNDEANIKNPITPNSPELTQIQIDRINSCVSEINENYSYVQPYNMENIICLCDHNICQTPNDCLNLNKCPTNENIIGGLSGQKDCDLDLPE